MIEDDQLSEKIDAICRHLGEGIVGAFITCEPAQPGKMHRFRVDTGRSSKLVGFTWEFIADTGVRALDQLLRESEITVRLALTKHTALLISHAGIREMESLP